MLYTGKGDKGKTKLYHCDQSLSKSSLVAEALGALDEINSLLGWSKTKAGVDNLTIGRKKLTLVLEEAQNNLFSIQAELAGAPKRLSSGTVKRAEKLINEIEQELPPIKSFIISGGTELSAGLDVARAVARRAERRVVTVVERGDVKISSTTLSYLNRLSSLLYALARLANYQAGVEEVKPSYK